MKDIKLVHLLTKPEENREKQSVKDMLKLCNDLPNINYFQIVNKPFDEHPPTDNVIFGNSHWVAGKEKPYGSWGLTAGHYGCFKAHKDALLDFFYNSEYDYLIIAECDCKIHIDSKLFDSYIEEMIPLLELDAYKLGTFVLPNHQSSFSNKISTNIYETDLIVQTHMYMVTKKSKEFFIRIFDQYGWHCIDWWFNLIFKKENQYFLSFKDIVLTSQHAGQSQIDRHPTNIN